MIKSLKWIASITALIASYFAGVYSTHFFQIATQPTNLADTTASVAALAGVIVAMVTIINWKNSKIQEDSYQLIKTYVAELVLIETTITDILIEIGSICPLAGNAVPTQAFVTETFQNIDTLRKSLSKLYRQLHQTKNELPFWGSKLTPAPEEHHKSLMKDLYNFQVVADCLRNNLENLFKSRSCTVAHVTQEYENLQDYFNKITITLTDRKTRKMSDMFTMEH